MESKKIGLLVRDLRKKNALSQENLAKQSGLSLRTIQRVENGETVPSGETITRISTILKIDPNNLIEVDTKSEVPRTIVKTKNEYLHIYDTKLIISPSPDIEDWNQHYGKSINNVFKSLMVFFVSIPLFTALSIIFYYMHMIGLAIYSGAFAFLFLTVAFYIILFTSNSTIIRLQDVNEIKLKKILLNNVVIIFHKEFGRIKKRALALDENQVETVKKILLLEKLLKEKNIDLKGDRSKILACIFIVVITLPFYLFLGNEANSNTQQMMTYYGAVIIAVCFLLIIAILRNYFKANPSEDRR